MSRSTLQQYEIALNRIFCMSAAACLCRRGGKQANALLDQIHSVASRQARIIYERRKALRDQRGGKEKE